MINARYPTDWLALELMKAKHQLGAWSDQRGPRRYKVVSEAAAATGAD